MDMDRPWRDDPKVFGTMEDETLEASIVRKLTDTERERWREQLQVRMSPHAMLELVDELHRITGSMMLVQAGLDFARDSWAAARFAKLRRADEVRLWPEDRPDFEMKVNGTHELFEVVEAVEPNRRRGAEYKLFHTRLRAGEDGVEHDPVENWVTRANKAHGMLESAALRKASGHYDRSWGLVILLDLSEFGIRQSEIEACMAIATASARN